MTEENTPLTGPEEPGPQPEPDCGQPPKRPEYSTAQRILALLGAIFVVIITLMYTYSLATGDLFFR